MSGDAKFFIFNTHHTPLPGPKVMDVRILSLVWINFRSKVITYSLNEKGKGNEWAIVLMYIHPLI